MAPNHMMLHLFFSGFQETNAYSVIMVDSNTAGILENKTKPM